MSSMKDTSWIFLFCIIVNSAYQARAQYVKERCVDETTPNVPTKLDCGVDGIISQVKLRSGTGSCQTPEGRRCFGLSPPLLVAKLNCYWKNNCTIKWPRDPIILPENGGDCLGRKPGFLEVSYKCFRPNIIIDSKKQPTTRKKISRFLIDICANLNGSNSQYNLTGSSQLSGIIRSHSIYPWDYDSTPRSCVVNVFWPTDQKLVVSVQNLEMAEGDLLTIGNYSSDSTDNMIPNKRLEFLGTDRRFNTIFNFTIGPYSNGGKGFVVCFKFTGRDDQSDLSACEEITIGGNIPESAVVSTTGIDIMKLLHTTPKEPTMKNALQPTEQPVIINKKCERKKPEKKKRCYNKLRRQGQPKKKKKDKPRKNKKKRKDKSKKDQ